MLTLDDIANVVWDVSTGALIHDCRHVRVLDPHPLFPSAVTS